MREEILSSDTDEGFEEDLTENKQLLGNNNSSPALEEERQPSQEFKESSDEGFVEDSDDKDFENEPGNNKSLWTRIKNKITGNNEEIKVSNVAFLALWKFHNDLNKYEKDEQNKIKGCYQKFHKKIYNILANSNENDEIVIKVEGREVAAITIGELKKMSGDPVKWVYDQIEANNKIKETHTINAEELTEKQQKLIQRKIENAKKTEDIKAQMDNQLNEQLVLAPSTPPPVSDDSIHR
ncbi:hypothetical protein [Spiroplasma eriocheiris]|uniref:Uncharacterized protein n=1 Tax=Spiroplasma eriocheiris TaxID=315358 RepID=A0A0H3XHC6_9MOLU|nr:hypothetical protein [Spiroplasma eriocheiris]AHF57608.1 hypothetical protein SPE_0480 [Spiroplasma eriocheiris CCTCC M 207170]AKM54063.1 hypothetical protein SERIO_v1c04860 [Spiroplasma eriocheiris]